MEEFFYDHNTIVECEFDYEDGTIDYDLPYHRPERITIRRAKNVKVLVHLGGVADWVYVTDKLTPQQLAYYTDWCEEKLSEAG